eukprot:scaffold1724_cov341-Pavlova_lutheri.AAC.36
MGTPKAKACVLEIWIAKAANREAGGKEDPYGKGKQCANSRSWAAHSHPRRPYHVSNSLFQLLQQTRVVGFHACFKTMHVILEEQKHEG